MIRFLNRITGKEKSCAVCPWWCCFTFDNPLRKLIHGPARMLEPFVKRGMDVLDVGCGMGYFSLGMAELVGADGTVTAADLQPEMLAGLARRARRRGLYERIRFQRCGAESIGVSGPVDFALAFWMVHEVPDQRRFLAEIRSMLAPSGRLLLVEPRFHVTARDFRATLEKAREAGLTVVNSPAIAFSRAALLVAVPNA